MKKKEFLKELENSLRGLPQRDIDERIEFYSEMIDDRIEDGKSEEEAVREVGPIDDVVSDIAKDTSLVKLLSNRVKPKNRISALGVILIILGFPLWFPLLMVFFSLILVLFIVLWALVIVTYAVEVALIGSSAVMGIMTFAQMTDGVPYQASLGLTLCALGGAILFVFVCILATKVCFRLNKSVLLGFKRGIIGGKKNA